MRVVSSVLLLAFMLSCGSTSKVSDSELDDLREQVTYLNAKVDSLEKMLQYDYDLQNYLRHDSLLFSYRRTPCLGNCPVFTFKVFKDGWASYEGDHYVDLLGVYTANLTEDQMESINQIFKEAHFYTFRDEYDDTRQDIPSFIIEYHGPNGVKKVVARTSIPHTFRKLAIKLQELSDEITWTPAE